MNDKLINLLLTLAAVALIIYGGYTMINKNDDKKKKVDEVMENIEFDYDKELDLIDNFILDENVKFNNDLKLRTAISNVDSNEIKKSKSSFNDINQYEFSGYYVKEKTIKEILDDLYGKNNYDLKSFYDNDSYYLYSKNDKCFYIFTSTLATNCASNGELVANCVEIMPYCEAKYSQDGNNIIANIGCINERNDIKVEYNDYQTKYSYKYIYNYDNSLKDYYISDIKFIKE